MFVVPKGECIYFLYGCITSNKQSENDVGVTGTQENNKLYIIVPPEIEHTTNEGVGWRPCAEFMVCDYQLIFCSSHHCTLINLIKDLQELLYFVHHRYSLRVLVNAVLCTYSLCLY